ncbi:MAG: hypothetical protein IJD89_00490 [Clostridia bacterium]|nr:hypothetical protein [Clostridia bacterium]
MVKKFIIALIAILILMFAEYRYIMTNLCPYYAEDGYLYIEVLGQVDTYYAEPLFVTE